MMRISKMLLMFNLLFSGCSPTKPTAPPPANGYYTDKPVYGKSPTANITVVDLGDLELNESEEQIQKIELPKPMIDGENVGFKGRVFHPDKRMIGGLVIARITANDDQGTEVIFNEGAGTCRGKDGVLPFQFELRFSKGPSRTHRFRLEFHGLKPGQDPSAPPDEWKVRLADQLIEIDPRN